MILVRVTWQILFSKNLIIMRTSNEEKTFQEQALSAVELFTDRNDPKEVLQSFRDIYDGYVESDRFIPIIHYDYRAIEELIEGIIVARKLENP
jgi:hypothetical protein